ncbi:hypothetical protein M1M11_23870 [Pseudomonas azerbaijanoccidens]|nr:hypothetical protein [Pseudomonas azerbaijanoccidentalis]MCK8667924.1 hypothetical protein [Pseudomonas azerbaijanoccidentalis]
MGLTRTPVTERTEDQRLALSVLGGKIDLSIAGDYLGDRFLVEVSV